jgi:hypothetical protein
MSYGSTSTMSEEYPLMQSARFTNEHGNTVPLEEFTEDNGGSPSSVDHMDDDFAIGWQPLIPIWYDPNDFVHWRKLIRMFLFQGISFCSVETYQPGELFAEWLGVTLFVYLGTGSVCASAPFEGRLSSASVVVISLGFGFGITTYVHGRLLLLRILTLAALAHVQNDLRDCSHQRRAPQPGRQPRHCDGAEDVGRERCAPAQLRKKIAVFFFVFCFFREIILCSLSGLLYWVAQCIGGICGSILIYLTLPLSLSQYTSYGATTLTQNGTTISSFSLVFIILLLLLH